MPKKTLVCLISIILILSASLYAQEAPGKYWIYFKDKNFSLQKTSSPEKYLSEKSIERRIRKFGDARISFSDLPVSGNYLREIKKLGIETVVVSKWLNAVSCWITTEQKDQISKRSFVKKIVSVRSADRPEPPSNDSSADFLKTSGTDDSKSDYGGSFLQNSMVHAVEMHDYGITGRGIYIGVIDDGFILNHEALDSIKVEAEYDFIHNDTNTAYDPQQDTDPTQGGHGTKVISAIAGFKESRLIGAAPDAYFALAKTEVIGSESRIEEDYYVAAAEWMDSLGVDIITSSIGYNWFDNSADDYTVDEMDGNTTAVTVASDIAVGKGIVVLTSAGNEGSNSWRIVSAPGDADSIIAVGAVRYDSTIAGFSSRGPTADGRIKPDIVAPGDNIFVAQHYGYTSYSSVDGTSYSAPIAAGVVALILSAHPELKPMDIVEAFKATSDRSKNINSQPDNSYGWGLIDAFKAATFFGPAFSNTPQIETISSGYRVTIHIVSMYGINTASPRLIYTVGQDLAETSLTMTQLDSVRFTAVIPSQEAFVPVNFYFTSEDMTGQSSTFPNDSMGSVFIYYDGQTGVTYTGDRDRDSARPVPDNFSLSQNYPNPFNLQTRINVEIPVSAPISLEIFDLLGNRIRTLYSGAITSGSRTFLWDGTNNSGLIVSSGIYIYRLAAPGFTETRKMLLLK